MPYTDHTQPNTTEEFNQVAPQYDGHFDNRFDRAEENVLFRRFAHLLQLSDVLDIGCGTGLVKRLSDRLVFNPRSYTGVDASAEMISQAVKPKTSEDALRTKFFVDDMVEFMWAQPPQSYDVVTSFYFPMNYCEQAPLKVYEAANYVLRPGGHFINVMASSRYAVRQSHIVRAANLRRYFEPNNHYMSPIYGYFKPVAIVGLNYFIERYRPWLKFCPQSIIEAMFRFDQILGEKSSMMPYIWAMDLQKPGLQYEKNPLDM